jgi:hypothetical protein
MTSSHRDILDWDTRVRATPAQTMDIRVVSTVAHEAAAACLAKKTMPLRTWRSGIFFDSCDVMRR